MNALLPRSQVHRWSEEIGNQADDHRAAITRLLRDQRRLSKFVEENAKSLAGVTGGVTVYLIGVVVRMFDLAGGRLRSVAWEDVRDAERRVQAQIEKLLPIGDGFVDRARALPRAQAHILDEALYALFERPPVEAEQNIDPTEAFKAYLLLWVATEALDRNWTPPKEFAGEAEYRFTPVEDPPPQASATP